MNVLYGHKICSKNNSQEDKIEYIVNLVKRDMYYLNVYM